MTSPEGPLDADPPAGEQDQSIEDMAKSNGQVPDADMEPLFALEGDKQLTLAGLGPRNAEIESEVSIMSASVPCRGLIDPSRPGQLLISYVPAAYRYVPVREGEKIVRWKLRQYLRVAYVEPVLEAQEAKAGADAE